LIAGKDKGSIGTVTKIADNKDIKWSHIIQHFFQIDKNQITNKYFIFNTPSQTSIWFCLLFLTMPVSDIEHFMEQHRTLKITIKRIFLFKVWIYQRSN
jgi:hypothetical protein